MSKPSPQSKIFKRGCLASLGVVLASGILAFLGLSAICWRVSEEALAVENHGDGTVNVPFHLNPADRKPALRCWVNGVPGEFFFDSGMEAALALQSRFADFCKVPITGKGKVLAHQTLEECQLGEVAHFAVGASDQFLQLENTRQNTEIGSWDYLPEFEGLLGANILTRHRAKIDFGEGKITFHLKDQANSPFPAEPESSARTGQFLVPLTLNSQGQLIVKLSIGEASGFFLVDTGSGDSFVSPEFRKRTGLPPGLVREGLMNGVPASSELFEAPGLLFGSSSEITDAVPLQVVSLDASNSEARKRGDLEIDGILGADFLMQNGAVIDYGSQMMAISTSKRGAGQKLWSTSKWQAFQSAGMSLREKNGYKRLQEQQAEGVSLSLQSIEPSPPAVLKPGEKFKIQIRYACPNVPNSLITVSGTYQGKTVPLRSFNLAPTTADSGVVEREITLKEPGKLDQLVVMLGKVVHQKAEGDSVSLVMNPIAMGEYPAQLEWRADSE